MQTRRCNQCAKIKPLIDYSLVDWTPRYEGFKAICKTCESANQRVRYQDMKRGRIPRRSFRLDNPA